jgi:D-glycero-D-manno-heptose 1,7-bisphosphate phosphatase
MSAYLQQRLHLDDVIVCTHDDADGCECRKPKPGMLLQAAKKWDIDLRRSYMVGDRWRDTEAGRAAGCRTVFVRAGYEEPSPRCPDIVVASLLEATEEILCQQV